MPVLQQEMKQLGGLKTDTKLSGLQKIEELRKLSVSFDEKISPLLNPDQQAKFKAMREQMRLRMLEEAAGKVKAKVEAKLTDLH